MNQYIEMTAEQTNTYDGDDDRAIRALMDELRATAHEIAARSGLPCEIYTTDGIVADVVFSD